jgi:hypothetical protein
MAGDVACLLADLLHTSGNDVFNSAGIDARTVNQSGQDMREEVHWMGLRECTPRPTLAEWRAYDIDDVCGTT